MDNFTPLEKHKSIYFFSKNKKFLDENKEAAEYWDYKHLDSDALNLSLLTNTEVKKRPSTTQTGGHRRSARYISFSFPHT